MKNHIEFPEIHFTDLLNESKSLNEIFMIKLILSTIASGIKQISKQFYSNLIFKASHNFTSIP